MTLFQHKIKIIFLVSATLAIVSSNIPQVYEFNQKACLIPHPVKAYRGGEDAYFSSSQLMIVADGVGSWADYGIDPAYYSRFLCSKGAELFEEDKTFYRQNLVEMIADTSRLNQYIGSSTMVALTIYGDKLRTCYIGDSGFVIFRLVDGQYKLEFEFKQQQHGFNFPYQLAMEEYLGDDPYLSICQEFTLEENDIIVVASDGLFDNLFVTEIMNLVNMNKDSDEKLFRVPEILAQMAIMRGTDLNFESPFSIKAKQFMLSYMGGKLDDTAVVLAKIKKIQPCLIAADKPQRMSQAHGSAVSQNKIIDVEEVSTYHSFEQTSDQDNQESMRGLETADENAQTQEEQSVETEDQNRRQQQFAQDTEGRIESDQPEELQQGESQKQKNSLRVDDSNESTDAQVLQVLVGN